MPDDDSYDKAVALVKDAVVMDTAKEYQAALELYNNALQVWFAFLFILAQTDICALQYFVPILHYETDATRRVKLKKSVDGYVRRAEEVKKLVNNGEEEVGVTPGGSRFTELARQISGEQESRIVELVELSRVTPSLSTG